MIPGKPTAVFCDNIIKAPESFRTPELFVYANSLKGFYLRLLFNLYLSSLFLLRATTANRIPAAASAAARITSQP